MSGLLPQSELDAIRAEYASFNTEAWTVSRTRASLNCRVVSAKGLPRVSGLPYVRGIPAYDVHAPYGSDLQSGDTLTRNGTTYLVWELVAGATLAVDVIGNAILCNMQARFERVQDGAPSLSVTVPAFLYPASYDAQLLPYGSEVRWAVAFDPSATYAGGLSIDENDALIWSGWQSGRTQIRHVRCTVGFGPAVAYVEDVQ